MVHNKRNNSIVLAVQGFTVMISPIYFLGFRLISKIAVLLITMPNQRILF